MSQNHKIARHTWGLRDALFEEWEALRKGKVTVAQARATAALAGAILKSVEVELAYVDHVNRVEKDGGKGVLAISREIRLGGA
jgi:hypothetical protein